jgi:hypothetical protein
MAVFSPLSLENRESTTSHAKRVQAESGAGGLGGRGGRADKQVSRVFCENSGKFMSKMLAKKCVFCGNIGLCVPEPISTTS